MGVVVIGRDEGERLCRSLSRALELGLPVVYVDSASSDGSPDKARELGCEVVALDGSRPLSPGRARNEGFRRLDQIVAGLEVVQFVDGDCVLAPGWMLRACAELQSRPEVAVVCGRLREERPGDSIYNRLCDLEWDAPAGEVSSCGGIALVRAEPFRTAGGFDPSLQAGEEARLCGQLRRRGHKILRVGLDMGRHDADLASFGQWWRRCVRDGFGSAQIAAHDCAARRRNRSALFWAAALPAAAAVAALPTRGLSLALLAGWPALITRIALQRRRGGDAWRDCWLYGFFCALTKAPHVIGWLACRLGGRGA